MSSTTENEDKYVEANSESAELPIKVFQAELKAINDRRENLSLSPAEDGPGEGPSVARGLIGIGLSGGGIRSSTFNLGLLQALDRFGLLRYADYLSTVSGGGYIGSCLSSVFAGASKENKKADPFPFPFRHTPGRPESKSFKHLREYSNYLKPPRSLAGLRLPGIVLRGLFVNFMIILPLILLLVVGTVLLAKNDIRDALNTRLLEYTVTNQTVKERFAPAMSAFEDYRHITIDLRSQIQWATHDNHLNFLISGLAEKARIEGGRRIGAHHWLLENQDPENLACLLKLPDKARALELDVTAWPNDNRAYQVFIAAQKCLGGTILVYKLIKLLPSLFDARQYVVPVSDKAKKDHVVQDSKGHALQVNLGDYVGWKKYILLSGLPKNSYSDCGKFLDKGRWLFDGAAAENLKLNMWIPNLDRDDNITVRAWQTRYADYLTVQKPKKIMAFYFDGQLKAEIRSCNDEKSTLVNPIAGSLPENPKIDELLHWCKFQWASIEENRYLRISNLPDGLKPANGQRLFENDWVFENDEIEAMDFDFNKEWLKGYSAGNPLRIIAWRSGKDKDLFDPVTLIYTSTFKVTKWLALLFGCLLVLFPLIRMIMSLCGITPWRRRDLLTRYLCGGGIAAVAIIAFLELQPLAIYLFYRLKTALDVAGIIGGADKVFAIAGSVAAAVGGIFSSKAMGQGSMLNTKIGLYAMGVIGPMVLWLFYLNLCGWALNPENIPDMLNDIQGYVLPFFLVVAIVTLIISRLFYNVNQTSLHPFYRDRLSKAFIFTLPESTDHAEHNDAQKLQSLNTKCAPYHLINTTLNINGKGDANLQGRNADFFIFSREYIGSQTTGYCRTDVYEARDKHMGLATAMAVSAAAAAPNMGRMTQKSMTFIMALLNIRLGYWVQNPNRIYRKRRCSQVGPIYLVKEMLGLVNEKSKCLNVSDGGHLENLGLYELVRRRCKYIIIGDAEADKHMTFKGLAEAIRMIRIDMGISIEIDLDSIYRKNGSGNCHYATGTICYGDGQKGYLLYIKSSVSHEHNPYIEDYMARNPDFPHESTADQFFGEDQFEAYRALGADVGQKVLEDKKGQKFLNGILTDSGNNSGDTIPIY